MLGSLLSVYVALAASYITPQVTPPPAAPPALFAVEAKVIEKTNAERARHGLAPLTLCPKLLKSARQHAYWMTTSRTLTHTTRPVAENIAMGQTSSHEVVGDWMNSSGHRANILDPGHRRIGVAAYTTPDGTIYWCQQFLR